MRRVFTAAILVFAVVAAGCGSSDEAASDGGSGTTVSVELKDFAIAPDTTSVPAGQVKFVARNGGPSEHELVLLKTDLGADALPTADGKVEEEGSGIEMIGEVEEFEAGATESATFDLSAGSYVLICNIPGHYQSGMAAAFTVE